MPGLGWRTAESNGDRTDTAPPLVLDEPARAIIEHLQQDGRRSYTAIAAAVGMSESAIRQRVKALIDLGVMRIVAVTDPLRLGFNLVAMVALSVDGDFRAVAEAVAEIPEVDYLVLTTGKYDLLAQLVARDNEHLLCLLNDRLRAIPGVRTTETFMYLGIEKHTNAWGAR
jgi:Lrp/AsnC family transcriptional regulator, regulator for asnA, asnC and gidA